MCKLKNFQFLWMILVLWESAKLSSKLSAPFFVSTSHEWLFLLLDISHTVWWCQCSAFGLVDCTSLVSVIHESFSSWTLSLLTFKIIPPPHPGLLQESVNNFTAFTRSTSPAQLGQCRWIHWLKINSSILLFHSKVIRGFCLINKTELGIENAPRSISSLPFKHNFLLLLPFIILSFKANYPPPFSVSASCFLASTSWWVFPLSFIIIFCRNNVIHQISFHTIVSLSSMPLRPASSFLCHDFGLSFAPLFYKGPSLVSHSPHCCHGNFSLVEIVSYHFPAWKHFLLSICQSKFFGLVFRSNHGIFMSHLLLYHFLSLCIFCSLPTC